MGIVSPPHSPTPKQEPNTKMTPPSRYAQRSWAECKEAKPHISTPSFIPVISVSISHHSSIPSHSLPQPQPNYSSHHLPPSFNLETDEERNKNNNMRSSKHQQERYLMQSTSNKALHSIHQSNPSSQKTKNKNKKLPSIHTQPIF